MTRLRYFGPATPVLRYSNWIIAALVSLFAVYLHVLFLLSGGGLWRDEAGFVHLSLLPSFSEVWQNLPHDSCPILMPLVVRAWSAAGLGNADFGLRILGLFVGLFLLLTFWFASWTMRNGVPLLAVTLAGLNVTMIRAGDSLRGYGLGSALGGSRAGSYLASSLPAQPCSFFLRGGGSRPECSVALPKCLFCIRRVLRRVCAMRRGTAVA